MFENSVHLVERSQIRTPFLVYLLFTTHINLRLNGQLNRHNVSCSMNDLSPVLSSELCRDSSFEPRLRAELAAWMLERITGPVANKEHCRRQ